MQTISAKNKVRLPIGKQGENLAQKIRFDEPITWAKEYGPGTVQLLHQRPGEDTPYPVAISREADGSYSWAVAAADTALAGRGQCELRYLSGDTVVKSRTWSTIVDDALGAPSETPPEAQTGWVDQVLAAGSAAQAAADRAAEAAVRQPYPNAGTGTWWVWDAEAGEYRDSGIASATYSLPPMTSTTLGGAMADPAQEGDTQPVRIGADKKLYTALAETGKQYELIETAEMTEGGITSFLSSGWALNAFACYIYSPSSEVAFSWSFGVYKNENQIGFVWLANMTNTTERYSAVFGKNMDGISILENITPSTTNYQTNGLSRQPKYSPGDMPFDKIFVYASGGNAFPVGTKFELWGVKANG